MRLSTNNAVYYTLKDHLGSASAVTDSSAIIVGTQRYYPYGETRLTTGTMYTDKLFTSQREMVGLGIYHYGARFYSPTSGRFIQSDSIISEPYNPQSLNRYAYVLNNPLGYTDPTGHDVDCGIGNGRGPKCREKASFWLDEVTNNFSNVKIKNPKSWQTNEARALFTTLDKARVKYRGSHTAFKTAYGNMTFEVVYWLGINVGGDSDPKTGEIKLTHWSFEAAKRCTGSEGWVIAHEMGHPLDMVWSYDGIWPWSDGNPKKYLSNLFVTVFNGGCRHLTSQDGCAAPNYNPTDKYTTGYGLTSSVEDFAESHAAFILGDPKNLVGPQRENVIQVYVDLYVSLFP